MNNMNNRHERTIADRIRAALAALPERALAALALRAARRAKALGLARRLADGTLAAIPLSLTPEVLPRAALEARGRDARLLLSAASKLVLTEPALRARLAAHLPPFEREALEQRFSDAGRLAIARVDWFFEGPAHAGRHFALELNATIPAMEAYSDVAVRAVAETLAPKNTERIAALSGRNSDELLASLQARDAELGRAPATRAVLVHRPGDSQLPELGALVARWRELGVDARTVEVGDYALEPGTLVYRHIFGHRIAEGSAFAAAARAPREHRLWNPIAAHLELKVLMAELSAATAGDAEARAAAAGLTPDELACAHRTLPWTRPLARGATLGPDGARVDDLVRYVREHAKSLVLKTSAGYGGKGVVIGPVAATAAGREACAHFVAAGVEPTWENVVDAAAAQPADTWVVQRFVTSVPSRHLLVSADDGVAQWAQGEGGQPGLPGGRWGAGALHWGDVFVDASSYTGLGDGFVPGGGVCRFASGHIVNIVGGGGVAPLITEDAAALLLEELSAS